MESLCDVVFHQVLPPCQRRTSGVGESAPPTECTLLKCNACLLIQLCLVGSSLAGLSRSGESAATSPHCNRRTHFGFQRRSSPAKILPGDRVSMISVATQHEPAKSSHASRHSGGCNSGGYAIHAPTSAMNQQLPFHMWELGLQLDTIARGGWQLLADRASDRNLEVDG